MIRPARGLRRPSGAAGGGAVDSPGLYRDKRAGSALAAFALETGLTRRCGFGWAYRPASKGRVITGVPEQAIAQFSQRRADHQGRPGAGERARGTRGPAPNQRALASMRQFAKRARARARRRARRTWRGCCPGGSSPRAARNSAHCASSRAPSGRGTSGTQTRAAAGWRAGARAEMDRMAGARLALRGMLTHAQERAAMAAGLALRRRSAPRGPRT